MELQIWKRKWGIPSIDHGCISVLAYCKFGDFSINVKELGNPWKSSSGDFPILKDLNNGTDIYGFLEILDYLKNKGFDLDKYLDDVQKGDNFTYSILIEHKLLPALLHLLWIDTKTFTEFTRPGYGSIVPFPLSLYIPIRKRNQVYENLNNLITLKGLTELEREILIIKEAKECLNILSSKLGEQNFFFGSRPSSLDALVYGYLVLIENITVSNALQNHLQLCENLTKLCQIITDKYFPLSQEEKDLKIKAKNKQQAKIVLVESEFPNKKRNMVIAALVTLSSMAVYALLVGLVKIDYANKKNKGSLIITDSKNKSK